MSKRRRRTERREMIQAAIQRGVFAGGDMVIDGQTFRDGPLLGPAYGVKLTDPVQPLGKPGLYPGESIADRLRLPQPDLINHPPHYTSHPSGVEVITFTEHMGFCLGNVVKYVMRADEKGTAVADLKKAAWYLNREIAKREAAL